MRCALSIPNVGDPIEMIELAVAAEEAGWDAFFLWDHLQLDAATWPDTHDPWVLLGGAAARTSRILLGTMVTPVPRRRPHKLAKEVVTLDHLSAGRVVLGVGLGVPIDLEYAAFGEPTRPRDHAAMLDEALPLLDAFLRGDPVDHEGPHYRVRAQLHPPARQRPRPPIWVAATFGHKRPLARARRWDGVFPLRSDRPLTPAELAEFVRELDPPPGYEVATGIGRGVGVSELADAGATWIIDGPDWLDESLAAVRRMVEAGPPDRVRSSSP